MKQNKRILAIDAIKTFAIICVVFGHCIQYGSGSCYLNNNLFFENWLFKIIYSFHMPLFMLISGYLFGNAIPQNPWYCPIVHKFRTLLIPVFCWSLLFVSLSFVSNLYHDSLFSLWHYSKQYASTSIHSLWFLWAVFWCSLCVTIVNRFFNDKISIYVVGLILSFFVPVGFSPSLYMYMYPYFVIGYLFKKGVFKIDKLSINKHSCAILLILYIVLILFYSTESYIYTSGYRVIKNGRFDTFQLITDMYRFLVGMIGSLFIISLFQMKSLYRSSTLNKVFSYIGSNTIGIYIVSGFIFNNILPKITAGCQSFNIFISLIECVAVMIVSLLINRVILKTKYSKSLLLGK